MTITTSGSISNLSPYLFKLAGRVPPPSYGATNYNSVLILGFARSGKSIIATQLREKIGFSIFSLDLIRNPYYSSPQVRRSYIDLLSRLYPFGLAVEGDNVIGENVSAADLRKPKEFRATIAELQNKIRIVFVGSSTCNVEEKTEAILHYRQDHDCWTSNANYSWSQVRNLAHRSIEYSQQLRIVGDEMGISYKEIRPSNFQTDMENATREILDEIVLDGA